MNNENNFPEIPNKPKKKFEVHIDDADYLAPVELDKITPPPVNKKKFEVHIDDYEAPQPVTNEHQPKYKGEIYFSNRKPVKPIQEPVNAVPADTGVTPVASKTVKKPIKNNNSKNKPKFKSLSNNVLLIFCTVVLILTCALSAFGITCINDILAINRSEEKVEVKIPQNATTDEVLDILKESGLIKQKTFSKFYLEFIQIFTHSKEPKYLSGVYYPESNLGLEGLLNEFKASNKEKDTVWLVFPEGWSAYQIIDRLNSSGVCSRDEMIAALSDADFEYDFIKKISNSNSRTFTLEGYLCPDTYEFFLDSDANSVIRKLINNSETNWTEEHEKRCAELGYTRDEIIILASIIQAEAANTDQMGMISAVLHNRLNNPGTYPKLECDSTKDYIKNKIAPNVSDGVATTLQNEYDTYKIEGLPPGPVCNPGEDAINAALYPDENYSDYFYFRHDVRGTIYMAKTFSEHRDNGDTVLSVNNQYSSGY